MDDNKFDDLIRDRVGEYEAPGYDPTALADLHYRMASQYSVPWHVRYRNEMLVAAASVMLAIALLWGQWRIGEAQNQTLRNEISALQEERAELKSIQDLFNTMSKAPDTVRIVERQEADEQLYRTLLDEIETLKRQLRYDAQSTANASPVSSAQLIYLGYEQDLPGEALSELKGDGTLVRRGQHLFLLATDSVRSDAHPWLARRKGILTEHLLPEYEFVPDTSYSHEEIVVSKVTERPVKISVKQMREIEKHYKKGVGIKLGPVLESYNGRYDVGDTEEGWGGGIMSDFIVSPSLSVETGIVFHGRIYGTERINELNLPPADTKLGEFQELEISSRLFEIPLNLKYRYPLNYRSDLVTSLGISGLLYTYQSIEYLYEFEAGEDFGFPVESSFHRDEPGWHFGTLNASLGLKRELRNKKEIELSLFYKHGLGDIGFEQVNADFFGLRGAYWFTLKK